MEAMLNDGITLNVFQRLQFETEAQQPSTSWSILSHYQCLIGMLDSLILRSRERNSRSEEMNLERVRKYYFEKLQESLQSSASSRTSEIFSEAGVPIQFKPKCPLDGPDMERLIKLTKDAIAKDEEEDKRWRPQQNNSLSSQLPFPNKQQDYVVPPPTHHHQNFHQHNYQAQDQYTPQTSQQQPQQPSVKQKFFARQEESISRGPRSVINNTPTVSSIPIHAPPFVKAALNINDNNRVQNSSHKSNGVQHHSREDPMDTTDENGEEKKGPFMSARQKLVKDAEKKGQSISSTSSTSTYKAKTSKKSVGAKRKFVTPFKKTEEEEEEEVQEEKKQKNDKKSLVEELMKNPALTGCEEHMVELITSEIIDRSPAVTWDDIAGLKFAKDTVHETIIFPLQRPDIFKGIRAPPKGLLLFGPPGTGKTMIGKAIASQSHSTFFSISASSLTSKWIGEGEKMVKTLFAVARCFQPAVIFIDEIDSLLTMRSETENEASRRIKTEFLVQFDGARIGTEDRLLVIGATNRPHELDEAARRRLVKRLYIPLPDMHARKVLIQSLLKNAEHSLSDSDLDNIAAKCEGYSGADVKALVSEAALGPVRGIDIYNIHCEEVRPINVSDFEVALKHVRPSVSQSDLQIYIEWNKTYGSFRIDGGSSTET